MDYDKLLEEAKGGHYHSTGNEPCFICRLVQAVKALRDDRDRWVALWEKAGNAVLRLQADLEQAQKEIQAWKDRG